MEFFIKLLAFVLISLLQGLVIWLIWNPLMVDLFALPEISYSQGVFVGILAKIIFTPVKLDDLT